MIKPDFFIVGAPKCGTTSLYHYCKDHPEIFMPEIKEPCYFADDFPDYRKIHSEEEYLKLFEGVQEQHQAVGEASVWYLYSQSAIRNIRDFNPDANIIVMIRNPVEVTYSLHNQNFYSNVDDVQDFEEAWRLRESRKNGENIPSTCPAPEHLYYDETAKFGDQLERLFDLFPRDQVNVIVFDDFADRTEQCFNETLDFLGIDSSYTPNLTPRNTSHEWKYPILGKITTEIPRRFQSIIRPIKQWLGIHSFRILGWLERFNTVNSEREPMDPALIEELQNTFRDDIEQTGELIDRDLSHWYRESPDKLKTGVENSG